MVNVQVKFLLRYLPAREVSNLTNWGELPDLMTIGETAKFLRRGRNCVYNLCHIKGFPAIKIGRKWLIVTAKLREWVERQAS